MASSKKKKVKAKAKSQPKAKSKTKKVAKPAKKAKPSKAKPVKAAALKPNVKKASGLIQFFTPLDDRVVVRQEKIAEKTAGGIYIPNMVQEKPQVATVVLVGRGRRDKKGKIRPMDVQVGDQILVNSYSNSTINLEGEEYLILREEEILGVYLAK